MRATGPLSQDICVGRYYIDIYNHFEICLLKLFKSYKFVTLFKSSLYYKYIPCLL